MNDTVEVLAEIVGKLVAILVVSCVYGYIIHLAFPLTFFQASILGFIFTVISTHLSNIAKK